MQIDKAVAQTKKLAASAIEQLKDPLDALQKALKDASRSETSDPYLLDSSHLVQTKVENMLSASVSAMITGKELDFSMKDIKGISADVHAKIRTPGACNVLLNLCVDIPCTLHRCAVTTAR